ncbi:MAG TPA: TetR/AcrR family transcriptional regulator [Aliidongia sp.]|uniref:TetR/AcrR family transcriptional regulator n=1 Tax=Aliidongia sp. TaxID=1914230 RepID=UPI002DDD0AE6|nr:TetR/AcrR family transcriptional regulator [Aliidongia sp.]HEV2674482.1 TetR/AcrR family transcriptional regulator [Aliidongia sp.]
MEDRLTAQDWLTAALGALARDGVAAVRVEPLAKRLGVTKGSFYWHFADRPALLAAVLEEWERRATDAIIVAVDTLGGDAAARLANLFRITAGADGRLENAVRNWAVGDAAVAELQSRVDDRRRAYLDALFRALGFAAAEAAARTHIAYQVVIGGFIIASGRSAGERRADADLLCRLLVQRSMSRTP